MKKKVRYNRKKLAGKRSGTELVYRKRRMMIIALWLVFSIIVGFAYYKYYSSAKMSDTPVKSIQLDGGVKTGCELKDDVPYGPWSPVEYNLSDQE